MYVVRTGLVFLIFGLTGALLAAAPKPGWTEVAGVKVPVPPPEHPRLYLRGAQVAQLPTRLQDPVLQPVVKRLESLAKKSRQFRVEWEALRYLAKPDKAAGRATVERTLAMLREVELPDQQDACRVTGRWMVTGAIVHDWLYPLLTTEEKRALVQELVRLAKT